MQCPYCRAPLAETSLECPSCQLSLHSVNALLAPMPRYVRGLNDRARVLGKREEKKIKAALSALPRSFPQVELHIAIQTFNPTYPIATHLFWLFNQGEFCASDRKGGKNHAILLGLDPAQGRVGLIVGYGLEPFLPQEVLDAVLDQAEGDLMSGNYARAILTIINALHEVMEEICDGLAETLGIEQVRSATTQEY